MICLILILIIRITSTQSVGFCRAFTTYHHYRSRTRAWIIVAAFRTVGAVWNCAFLAQNGIGGIDGTAAISAKNGLFFP
jgi:hypothetical protein